MKFSLALFAAFLAACQISGLDVSPGFQIGEEYKYEYKSRVATGIPEKGIMQFSGIGLKGDVVIQNKDNYLFFKFVNLKIANFNGKREEGIDEEIELDYVPIEAPHEFVKDALNKPVRVMMTKGMVKSLDFFTDDPMWSINVKKAIVSHFQLIFDRDNENRLTKDIVFKPDESDDHYKIKEGGIGGDCTTVYQISQNPYFKLPTAHVLNVTKTRLHSQCTHRPVSHFSTHSGYKCAECKATSFNPLKSVSFTDYQLRGDRNIYTIEKIYNNGKYIFTPFTTRGQTIISGVNQTLFLVDTHPIVNPIVFPENFVTHKSLIYNTTTEFPDVIDLTKPNSYNHPLSYAFKNPKQQIEKFLIRLAHDHALTDTFEKENLPEFFLGLVKVMSTLNYNDIMDVYKTYLSFDYATATPEQQRMKMAFYDALVVCGTNPAVKYILYVLEKELLPSKVAASYFMQVPFYVKSPNEELIAEFYKFTKTIDKTTKPELYKMMWLAFGTLVKHGCEPSEEDDTVPLLDHSTCINYLEKVNHLIDEAKETWEELLFIKVMGNMHLKESYKFLKHHVTGDVHCPEEIRVQALWSLASCVGELREEIISLVAPIYFNYSESFDMRASAFEIMLYAKPSYSFWQYVGEKLNKEPCHQVASYVYSTFVAMANSTNPCHYKIGKQMRTVLDIIPPLKFGYQYSRKVVLNYFNDKYAFGGETLMAWGGSNESIVPESFYIEQSANIFGRNFNYFAFGIDTKGFTSFYKKIAKLFDPTDESKTLFNIFRRKTRSVDTVKKELDEIKNAVKVTPRHHHDTKAHLSFSVFNQEVKFFYFDEHTIQSLKDDYFTIPKEWPKLLSDGYKVNYQKTNLIASVYYEFPTDLGFPLSLSLQVPAYISVTGDLKFKVEPGFFTEDYGFKKPTELHLTTNLETILHVKTIAKVGIRTPILNSYGYGLTHDVEAKFPLKIDTSYNFKEHKFNFEYTPSKEAYEMIHTESHPFTYNDIINDYIPVSKTPNLVPVVYNEHPHEYDFKFGHKYFGAGLHVQRKQEYHWDNFGSYYKFFSSFFTKKSPTFDYSKYHYNFFQRILTGYYSMRDYFFYYPTLKPYEFKVFFEPSTENPTDHYEVTVDFHKYYKTSDGPYEYDGTKGESIVKLDPTFRKVYWTHIDLVAHGKTLRKYHVDFNISYPSLGNMPRKFSLEYHRTPVPNYDTNPFKLCYQASFKFPPMTKYYTIDTTHDLKAEGIFTLNFGKDCTTDKKITVTSVVEKTDEQKMYDTDPLKYCPYYKRCVEDKKAGYTLSPACWKYFYNYYMLKKYTFDVEYHNLPEYFYTQLNHFSYWFKYTHFTNMDVIKKPTSVPDGHIKIYANFSSDSPARLDLKVVKPTEKVIYTDLYYPRYFPFFQHANLRIAPRDQWLKKMFGYAYKPVCRLEGDHVFTFDHVHYKEPLTSCYHIVAKDCSKKASFTLLAKKVKHETFNKALKLFVVGHKIEILPIGATPETAPLVLRVDDVKKHLTPGSLFIMPDPEHKDRPLFKIFNIDGDYTIVIPSKRLAFVFDGKFLITKPSNFYRGYMCGICGDFNGESTYDFVAPNECVYTEEESFVHSYVVPDGTCTVPKLDHEEGCYHPHSHKYPDSCTIRRNKMVYDAPIDPSKAPANNVCFSTVAIPECLDKCKPTRMVKSRFGFHCLNIRDPTTATLTKDKKVRELTELLYKSQDYQEIVEFPESCVYDNSN